MLHLVQAFFDPDSKDLTIEEGNVTLVTERDTVVWDFVNIDSDHQPAIVFQDGNPLGPFASLDQLPNQILGMGNTADGSCRNRSYRAALIQSDAAPIESMNSATINNPISEKYSPLTIRVAPDPAARDTLRVVPSVAEIFSGQSVTWNFEDIPLDTYAPRLEFTSVPAKVPRRGPFESLTISQPDPASQGRYSAQIVGAVANGIVGSSYYRILAVRIDGSGMLRTHPASDPQLDDMGPPPGGEGAGGGQVA